MGDINFASNRLRASLNPSRERQSEPLLGYSFRLIVTTVKHRGSAHISQMQLTHSFKQPLIKPRSISHILYTLDEHGAKRQSINV